MKSFLSFLMLFISPALFAGTNQYITDKVYAPVRSEQSEKGKIIHNGLESGTAVTVLEKNDQSGYAKIRTGNNVEGWIRLQYLSEEPVAAVLLEQANAQIAQLQEKTRKQEEELIAVRQISTSQIDTHERNAELVKQTQLLISENEVLKTDNDRLKSRNNQTWFFYGGILVAISSLISVLIPRLTKKRRNDGWA
ncbi:MAG TPA: TIGR04211 family SH3 domain-containing protein [Pseudomonadales bacterium]|nr:TIGR04211 family SH3 domain-containing protein [Pseudomonadales bacterium]